MINICSRAALVESAARLRPGAQTEMQLAGAGARVSVKGRLDRCYVAALEPIRYRGVLIFDQRVEVGEDRERRSRVASAHALRSHMGTCYSL